MKKHVPAWTKRTRLKNALCRVQRVRKSRSSTVHRDPQLIDIVDSLRQGDVSAGRCALDRYLMVCPDLLPEHRSMLEMARDDLEQPWDRYPAIGLTVRIILATAGFIKWLISLGPNHFQGEAPFIQHEKRNYN